MPKKISYIYYLWSRNIKRAADLFIKIWIAVFITGCSTFLFHKTPSYIKVNGIHFQLDDKPYYFLGTNLWYGCYLGSSGETGNRERLIKELDLLESLGITNLRILAASEKSEIKNSLKPAIQNSPGKYDEDLLEGLDFLLNEMGKRNMYAVVFLNNYWEWSGGMAQYNAWFPDSASNKTGKVADPENPVFGWGEFMRLSATFYTNEKANRHFKEFIRMIITRKNKFNDYYYYEDPAIMAWQLANEPRPWGTPEQVENYYRWVDTIAAFIHSIDPNHLVTTGNEGTMGSLGSEEYYLNAHKSRYIDYMTFHLWAKNWGWFDAKKIDETYPSTESKAVDYIKKHFKFARLLNKPVTMEEFGMARDSEIFIPGYPSTARDRYFQTIFQLVYDSASAGSPISGTNFWTWGGFGRARHNDFKWRNGDPFLGDPPQEAQGLNSVFDTDSSTLAVLKKYSHLMNLLCEGTFSSSK
ncbi:MAG: glycoside hydrolase 5 family protein [Ignavibacteria bacterium]